MITDHGLIEIVKKLDDLYAYLMQIDTLMWYLVSILQLANDQMI